MAIFHGKPENQTAMELHQSIGQYPANPTQYPTGPQIHPPTMETAHPMRAMLTNGAMAILAKILMAYRDQKAESNTGKVKIVAAMLVETISFRNPGSRRRLNATEISVLAQTSHKVARAESWKPTS